MKAVMDPDAQEKILMFKQDGLWRIKVPESLRKKEKTLRLTLKELSLSWILDSVAMTQ